ncbi:hypothetical protein MATL_G00081080 [Megalops atlanticus]|uniref:Suppressor of cytokine signaling 2 n=1 Tax=Megalops atlanticus TaxID=7932 RepID=A0A9D3Q8K7_MEGAT|nr:hypothetical protein MATL_G00081080 [Megalops atlanticus]
MKEKEGRSPAVLIKAYPLCFCRPGMGHMQCTSQVREADEEAHRVQDRTHLSGSFRHKQTSSGVLMILNTGKWHSPAGAKGSGPHLRGGESTADMPHLERAMAHLRESGWYWGSITAAQAKEVLGGAREGSFLLRDSSRPGYQLTLSVQSSLGPTHLRIESAGGTFGFDSLAMARPRLRRFSGVVQLVQHYALTCRGRPRPLDPPTQEEEGPDRPLQLQLTRPLYRTAPSLQHLCRITINQHSDAHSDLPLPGTLTAFLQEYPFLL